KAMIATESGDPGLGFGIANSALSDREALTPRLRAVILRQRSYSNAALGDVLALPRDSEEAVAEAIAGERQDEKDRAPYCTPAYAAMEASASWALLGHARTALPILEKSRLEWARGFVQAGTRGGLMHPLLPGATTADAKARAAKCAILPVGSFEQHGDYLPLITDTVVATGIAQELSTA